MKANERKLTNLLGSGDKLYIFLSDETTQNEFMNDAENEGFHFSDGTKPTDRKANTIMEIFDDKTICFIGFAGCMAYHHATRNGDKFIVRIDYRRYKDGEANYFCDEIKCDDSITVNRSTEPSPSIGDGSSAFLIFDENIQTNDEFFSWLKQEVFLFWSSSKGWYSGASWKVCWIYVNLNSKLIARGMPGIRVTSEVGKHAITIDDFKTIYAIYKKYAGLAPLKFE